MDRDGYPTDKELREIENFSGDLFDFLDKIKALWIWKDRFCLKGKRVLRLYLSTGGWSGHESVIASLKGTYFWYFFWVKSIRGGHYWFRIPMKQVGNFKNWGKIKARRRKRNDKN